MDKNILKKVDFKKLDYQLKYEKKASAQYSVMLLLVDYEDELHMLFELRSKLLSLQSQPGDVSFPGGFCENADTVTEALRETHEEIGLLPQDIEICGIMADMTAGSGRTITPIVGYVPHFRWEMLKLNPKEVEEVFLVPLQYFMENEPEKHHVEYKPFFKDDFPFDKIANGRNYRWKKRSNDILFYFYKQYSIWGFTATMTNHFIYILKKYLAEN